MSRLLVFGVLALVGCQGKFLTVRSATNPSLSQAQIEALLSDPRARGTVPWQALLDTTTEKKILLEELPELIQRLNKLEIRGTLTQTGSNVEVRVTNGTFTIFLNVQGPLFTGQPTSAGLAEVTFGNGAPSFRSDVGVDTFFQFTLTGINRSRGDASATFEFLGRDPTGGTTDLLLIMEGQFAMEIG